MKDLKHIKRFNESEENLNVSDVRSMSNSEIIQTLDETNLSNEYDRLKLFYQLTIDGYVKQNQFCEILEDYFGLRV
jgi:hypothetical protein